MSLDGKYTYSVFVSGPNTHCILCVCKLDANIHSEVLDGMVVRNAIDDRCDIVIK